MLLSQAIKQKLSVNKSRFYVESASAVPSLSATDLHDEEKAKLLLGDLSTPTDKHTKKGLGAKAKKWQENINHGCGKFHYIHLSHISVW